jgi:hypothetical protein
VFSHIGIQQKELKRLPREFEALNISIHLTRLSNSIGVSENGWIDDEHALSWLKKAFINQAKAHNKSGKPILLICDGHGSHTTAPMLLKARNENIFILRLPPHCTHKLQPLDVGVLGPLQAQFADNMDTYVTRNGCGVGKKEFIQEYVDARV